jgi:hypothetical protein
MVPFQIGPLSQSLTGYVGGNRLRLHTYLNFRGREGSPLARGGFFNWPLDGAVL